MHKEFLEISTFEAFETLKFLNFVAMNFQVVKNSRMCTRVQFSFENLKIWSFHGAEFSSSKILVCERVRGFLFENLIFTAISWCWIFQWSKSSYVHACGDFFLKTLFLLLFRSAEFSSVQNPRMCTRVGISFWKPYFYCYFMVLNFPVVKFSYVHECGDFFLKILFLLLFCDSEFSSDQNSRMCTRAWISF